MNVRVGIWIGASVLLASCSMGKFESLRAIPDSASTRSGPRPMFRLDSTVCDPLSDYIPYGSDTMGLRGKLYYLSDTMPRFTTVENIPSAIDAGIDLFLNDVNVPTRMFDRGFPTAAGTLLQAEGKTLVEWFGINVDSEIVLDGDDAPGAYQFAMIADDGAVMEVSEVNSDAGFKKFIDDDGTHSSRLACALKPVEFATNSHLPTRIKYYQGPRTEIALMLLWRKVDPNNPPSEPLCGATGQNLYFEYHNNPSTPQPAYLDLQGRGWEPLKPSNFRIRGSQGGVNPCNTNDNWL